MNTLRPWAKLHPNRDLLEVRRPTKKDVNSVSQAEQIHATRFAKEARVLIRTPRCGSRCVLINCKSLLGDNLLL